MRFRFQFKNRLVDPFVGFHHGFDGEALLDPLAARAAIDFTEALAGPARPRGRC